MGFYAELPDFETAGGNYGIISIGETEGNDMQVSKKLENGKLTLVVSGRLDTNTSPELEAELSFDGVSDVVFDFGGLEYISSAGLRVLLTARKALMPTGGNMSVINANDTVRGVLEITGCGELFGLV